VRTHPATGEKALFVNPQFTRYIVGFKQEESDYLLKFLYEHIAWSQDIQARVRWRPNTVVVWDNRVSRDLIPCLKRADNKQVTTHSALIDWQDGQRRHIARITPQAERPSE
jgi:sulfonate dioxygenase